MQIKPIKTDEDYHVALRAVSRPIEMDPAPGTPEGDQLELLGALSETWERRHEAAEVPNGLRTQR